MRSAWVVPFTHAPFTMPDPVTGVDRIASWGRIGGPVPYGDGRETNIVWVETDEATTAEMAANPDYVRLPDA